MSEIIPIRRRTFPKKHPCRALANWLTRNNITQWEFSYRVGVAQSAVSNWINVGYRPRERTMRRVIKATRGEITESSWSGESAHV